MTMLQHIRIENMAVIEEADINFDAGLTVLTGETGAGKSIIIDALNMVLGERSNRDLVRTGCDKAEVTALFVELSKPLLDTLYDMGYEAEDGQLLIRRRISADGKSSCYLNGAPITVAMLRSIGRMLVNIHGQHDNQMLLSEDKQRDYIDAIGNLQTVKEVYLEAYRRYGTIARRLKKLRSDEADKEQRMDTLRFRLQELEGFAPWEGEWDELTDQRNRMRHAEKIADALMRADTALNGIEDQNGVLANLQQAIESIESLADVLPTMRSMTEKMQSIRYDLEEIASDISRERHTSTFDESEKERIENRYSDLKRLLGKYGPTESEMLAYIDNAKAELHTLENRDEVIAEDEQLLAQAEQDTIKAAEMLTNARRTTANQFAKDVIAQLQFLDMPGTKLSVSMQPTTLTATGGDDLTFMLAANAGEDAKPLSRSASGGELSRIMLAIKSVMAGADDIDTLVFDEIDTGISGHAARKVGIKLKETASSRQVLCVTHLAQIAAAADRQLVVKKEIVGDRTCTKVETVTGEAREQELSRIISGEVTSAGIEAARDMLRRSKEETV